MSRLLWAVRLGELCATRNCLSVTVCLVTLAAAGCHDPELATTPPDLDEVPRSVAALAEELAGCPFTIAGSSERKAIDKARIDANQDQTTDGSKRCVVAVYVWSGVMPLSRIGVENITAATEDLGIQLALIDGEGLWDLLGAPDAETGPSRRETPADTTQPMDMTVQGENESALLSETPARGAERALASELIRAGATVHYPALIIFDRRGIVGPAVLGFKTEDAYLKMIAERLNRGGGSGSKRAEHASNTVLGTAAARRSYRDIEINGHPGAYFRHIPGRDVVGLEIQKKNYTVDLANGERYWAPGIVDLVPAPDGLFLVTPRTARGGLEFHNSAEMFAQQVPVTSTQNALEFVPLYVDLEMQDQYPSVGLLEQEEDFSTYRVLTSWFDGIIHRDYEIRRGSADGRMEVQPLGKPIHTCSEFQLSTPIMAKNGREVAARDEATGTTKIFKINDDSSCDEVLDIGMQTGKVAWDSTGRRIAFAIPRGSARDESGNLRRLHGVFVLDRETLSLMRVPGSTDMNRLTFPEFVDDTAVIFLIRDSIDAGGRSRFRLFCCLD